MGEVVMRKDFSIKMLKALEVIERPQGAGIKEIAQKCEISERSAYRLLEAMEEMGIPLINEQNPYGSTNQKRWKSIARQSHTPEIQKLIALDNKERLIISLALDNMKLFETEALSDRINSIKEKLVQKRITTVKNSTDFLVSMKGKKDYTGKEDIIQTILTAVDKKTQCSVTYSAACSGETKTYTIEPYTLMEYNNGLYIICLIPKYETTRLLAVDRIQKLEILQSVFIIPETYNPADLFSGTFGIIKDTPMNIVLHFSHKTAIYIRERIIADNQIIEELDDGSIILKFHACGKPEIKSWILGFGSEVTVLEPEDLKEEIKHDIENMKKNYQ